jgi:hypothetical protein
LKEITSPVGVITLSDVDANSATGDVVRGSNLLVGDNVKKLSTSTDVSAVLLTPITPDSSSNAKTSSGPSGTKSVH